MNKKIIFIFLALVAVGGFFGYWYYRDTFSSKEIVKLEILGPDTTNLGDEIEYTIRYKNNGNFVLQNPKLVFQLPENSLTEDGKTLLTQTLNDIYPGDENAIKIKTRLLGKEGDLKVAHVWLSYTPKNLSVRYEADTTFTTKINSVPITFAYDLPSRIEKGKEIAYAINYFSNIDYPLENLSIKVDAVSGFNIKSSVPTSLDNSEWKLDTLNKAQGGKVTIDGIVGADAGSHLTFSAKLGMWVDGSFIVIKEASQDVQVIQSQLFISQQINGSSNYIASPGETLHYQISFRNIGSTPFNDILATAKLNGSAFDFSTLQSEYGQVQPNNFLVTFDSKQISQLQHLDPQQEADVSFTIKLKDRWTPSDAEKNNTMIKSNVEALDVNQELNTKVNSKLELSQSQTNSAGVSTITWQIKNYFNDVKNVKVKLVLPQGATLNDTLSPEDQASHFSFDSQSREIIWLVGDMAAGTGVVNAPNTLSFQVTMSAGSVVGQATVSGEDQVTGATIQAMAN